jgi:pyruvate carboxylase subunit B
MSNYCVSIGEHEYQVKVNGAHLTLNGEPVQFDLDSLNGNGLHVLRRGNQSTELYLSTQQRGVYEVLVGGRRVIARVDTNLAHRRARRRADAIAAGDLIAPMPGVVIQVMAAEGDLVEQDQVLAVLESMKMQMQVRAPFAGRVRRVNIKEGAAVEKGALLVKISEQ